MRRPRRPTPPAPEVGRPGILSLGRPHPRYDLTQTPGFETEAFVTEMDRRHARKLRRHAAVVGGKAAKALLRLADRIDPDVTDYPDTPVSQRYMREQRIRILGALWRLINGA